MRTPRARWQSKKPESEIPALVILREMAELEIQLAASEAEKSWAAESDHAQGAGLGNGLGAFGELVGQDRNGGFAVSAGSNREVLGDRDLGDTGKVGRVNQLLSLRIVKHREGNELSAGAAGQQGAKAGGFGHNHFAGSDEGGPADGQGQIGDGRIGINRELEQRVLLHDAGGGRGEPSSAELKARVTRCVDRRHAYGAGWNLKTWGIRGSRVSEIRVCLVLDRAAKTTSQILVIRGGWTGAGKRSHSARQNQRKRNYHTLHSGLSIPRS